MTYQAPGVAAGQGTEVPGAASTNEALTTPTPVTPVAAPSWLTGADETTVGYVQNKGWKEPVQVLESYRNLEKLLGADKAGNAVVLPKPDAPQAEVDAFYNRLGRPADAAGYKIAVPEGVDPEFSKVAGTWFHELGLTQKQGEALAAKWNEYMGTAITGMKQAEEQKFQQEDQALRQEWGAAFTQELAKAQTAARALGVTPEMIDNMQKSMGHKATMQFFAKIGAKTGEPDFVTGDKTEQFGAAMTPGQAQAKIAELTADKNFVSRYINKDAAAVAEMKRLHEFAFPEVK